VNIFVKIDIWGDGLKPFSVGKFAVHGCSPWQCREILCRILRNFDLCLGRHIVYLCNEDLPVIFVTKIMKKSLFCVMFVCNQPDLTTMTSFLVTRLD